MPGKYTPLQANFTKPKRTDFLIRKNTEITKYFYLNLTPCHFRYSPVSPNVIGHLAHMGILHKPSLHVRKIRNELFFY